MIIQWSAKANRIRKYTWKALQKLGLAPDECLVFEDSMAGVKSALGAGIRVIGVTTTHTAAELNLAGTFATIGEFPPLGKLPGI